MIFFLHKNSSLNQWSMDCSKGYDHLGSNKALKLLFDLCIQIPEVMICCKVVWARPGVSGLLCRKRRIKS